MTTMMNNSQATPSAVPVNFSMPRLLLHAEGLAVFIAAIALYAQQSGQWVAFALLLLTPDLSMIGYLVNTRVGAITYNLVHTYTLPILLALMSLSAGWSLGLSLALIWLAHIGMDRTFGYGLKYPSSFKETHFNRL